MTVSNASAISLLSVIQDILKTKTIEEAFVELDRLKKDKNRDVVLYSYIITAVCEAFNTTPEKLFAKSGADGIADAKRAAYVLLNQHLEMTHRKISVVFSTNRTTVTMSIREFKSRIPRNYSEFFSMFEKAQNRIMNYLKEQ